MTYFAPKHSRPLPIFAIQEPIAVDMWKTVSEGEIVQDDNLGVCVRLPKVKIVFLLEPFMEFW